MTLLVALAALGVLLPAGTALGGVADERGQGAAQEQVTTENATQQELAENWNYYQQSTQGPPAELKARMQADTTQHELSDRWTYYYHATRMSPADLKAWLQAQRTRNFTPPAAQVPTPLQPDQPTGQPGWLVATLAALAAVLAAVAGLATLAARRAIRRARVGQAT